MKDTRIKMTVAEAIRETMNCAKQIVQSYGPNTIPQVDRDNLCRTMEHYATLALKEYAE